MYRSSNTRRSKGFTLIELLVVIAIIAILAAILFPVFTRAKKSASKTNCGSNLKQIASAVFQYCEDHDGRTPRTAAMNATTGVIDTGTLYDQSTFINTNAACFDLKPYVKSTNLWRCPGAGMSCDYLEPSHIRYEVDYRFNGYMNAVIQTRINGRYVSTYCTKRLDSCTRPKRFYIISDRHSNHHADNPGGTTTTNAGWRTCPMLMVMADGHLQGDVRPYSGSKWQDSSGMYKYSHWDFPQCHVKDPGVVTEYAP